MEEPSQQGGTVQQFFWEQPARVPHSAQLSPRKPMALSSNSCKLPGFSSFWSFYCCYLKRSFAFPPQAPQSSWGLFWFLSPHHCRRYVLSALATSGALHGLIRKFFVCVELPVFASLQTEEPTVHCPCLRESSHDHT